MSISRRTRFEVLRRDQHRCRYCGTTALDGSGLTVDHVLPVALGGSDDPANLVAACRDCNAGKSATSPGEHLVAQVATDALRWSQAMRAAAAEMQAKAEDEARYLDDFRQEWERWQRGGRPIELPVIWRSAVGGWRRSGLPMPVLAEAIEIAMTRKAIGDDALFAYLSGIVRNKLTSLAERAREIIRAEDEPVAGCGHCDECTGRYGGDPDPSACQVAIGEPTELNVHDRHDKPCPYCGLYSTCLWWCGLQEGWVKGHEAGWQDGCEEGSSIPSHAEWTLSNVVDRGWDHMVATNAAMADSWTGQVPWIWMPEAQAS